MRAAANGDNALSEYNEKANRRNRIARMIVHRTGI
jgi:hypothetical protein